jgi:hypothetical protein
MEMLRCGPLAVAGVAMIFLLGCGGIKPDTDTASTKPQGAKARPSAAETFHTHPAIKLARPLEFAASGRLPQELEHISLNMSLADVMDRHSELWRVDRKSPDDEFSVGMSHELCSPPDRDAVPYLRVFFSEGRVDSRSPGRRRTKASRV